MILDMMRYLSKTVTTCAVFTAIGLILGYIESFIVIPVRIPGIRIGLANTVTLIMMYLLGPLPTVFVLLARITLSALLFGSPVSFIYSLAGALAAFGGMLLFKKLGFSVYGVSVFGAVLHNTAQVVTAWFFVGSTYVFYYIFMLIPAGIICGLAVGAISAVLIGRLGGIIHKEEEMI